MSRSVSLATRFAILRGSRRAKAPRLDASAGPFPTTAFTSLPLDHCTNLGAESVKGERFRQHVHAGIQKVASDRSVLRIAGPKENFQVGPGGAGNFRQLAAVDVGQHDVGHHEVDAANGLQDGNRLTRVGAERAIKRVLFTCNVMDSYMVLGAM